MSRYVRIKEPSIIMDMGSSHFLVPKELEDLFETDRFEKARVRDIEEGTMARIESEKGSALKIVMEEGAQYRIYTSRSLVLFLTELENRVLDISRKDQI